MSREQTPDRDKSEIAGCYAGAGTVIAAVIILAFFVVHASSCSQTQPGRDRPALQIQE